MHRDTWGTEVSRFWSFHLLTIRKVFSISGIVSVLEKAQMHLCFYLKNRIFPYWVAGRCRLLLLCLLHTQSHVGVTAACAPGLETWPCHEQTEQGEKKKSEMHCRNQARWHTCWGMVTPSRQHTHYTGRHNGLPVGLKLAFVPAQACTLPSLCLHKRTACQLVPP